MSDTERNSAWELTPLHAAPPCYAVCQRVWIQEAMHPGLCFQGQPATDGGLEAIKKHRLHKAKASPSLLSDSASSSAQWGWRLFTHEGWSVKFMRHGGGNIQGARRQTACRSAFFHLIASKQI